MPSTVPEVAGAAGVLMDSTGRVLLARRQDGKHLGGLWEFPGGRIEPGEDPAGALARELHEELGIVVEAFEPLIHVRHAYPDKLVALWFFRVSKWLGEPHGREGQPLKWVAPEDVIAGELPPADVPVMTALKLPAVYAISAAARFGISAFLGAAERALANGVRMIQLREPDITQSQFEVLARQTLRLCRQSGAKLLVNADPAVANALDADGVHLPAKRFMHLRERPLGLDKLVAASCHDEAELAQAARIGCDFCVLSPVLPTASHPGAPTLGWERFRRLCLGASLPVYALGGMLRDHAAIARANWGQGVAMLGGIWTMADG